MIVKKQDAGKREFKGISLDVLAVGEKSMIVKYYFKAGDRLPPHSHPHEQSGYIISGRFQLKIAEQTDILQAGDSYSIPSGTVHSAEALEKTTGLDFFVPPREDYL